MNNILKKHVGRINKMLAIILVLMTGYAMSGCSDFLEKNPLGKLGENLITTKITVEKLLISCYSPLSGAMKGTWGVLTGPENWIYAELCSGNVHKGSTTGDLGYLLQLERFTSTSDNQALYEKWLIVYGGIERCNNVLRIIKKGQIQDLTEADKTEIMAEARFLRGYYHFEAKKIWNMVPYVDENVEDPQKRVPNDKNIWSNIEEDFHFAMDNLPINQNEPGRPTKYAAESFLAKVYLFQQKYNEAKPLLDEVISSNKYKLLDNYYDNFNAAKNNNEEAIWQNQVAVSISGAGNDRTQRGINLTYPHSGDLPQLSAAGFCQPTFDLVNAYQTDELGLPMVDSYFNNDFHNDMNIDSKDEYVPDMETLIDPRLDWVVGRRGVPYHDWGIHPGKKWIRDQISAGPYVQKKYTILKSQTDKYSNDQHAKNNAMNYNMIRYAQVLLWAAECEVEVGSPEKAREYVNMIRERARDGYYVRLGDKAPFGDGPVAANYKVDIYKDSWAGKSKDWLRKHVRFEERLELALEGHFFFDLVRWGIAEEFINAYIAREKKYIQYLTDVRFDKNHCYFAIPLVEIDRSYLDGKPTLTQNPGY